MAALVLAAQGRIDFPVFLFASVGEDSENPATLAYLQEHAKPYAEANGIELHELRRVKRDGSTETLHASLTKEGSRSIDIPMRMDGSGAPGIRNCTANFKIKVIAKWQREHGATKTNQAVCGLGISVDEIHRARSESGIPYQTLEYPLLTLRLTRQDCRNVISREGLPVPPKSSCYFCPYHTLKAWKTLRETEPELFAKSVALENTLNERRKMLGKDSMWLTRKLRPLDEAIGTAEQDAFDFDGLDMCESGYCMT